jgi:hypothetical protein
LEDFGFLDEMDAFFGRREHVGRGRMPSRRNPVFDVLGTEDSETIKAPIPHGLYLVKSICCNIAVFAEIAEVAQVSAQICGLSRPDFHISSHSSIIYILDP